jgi:hypothetical protein
MRWSKRLRRFTRDRRYEEEENTMAYDGGQGPVDSSGWKQPVASHKDGEVLAPPAPTQQTESGIERTPTPDPYTDDNPHVIRNFGRS